MVGDGCEGCLVRWTCNSLLVSYVSFPKRDLCTPQGMGIAKGEADLQKAYGREMDEGRIQIDHLVEEHQVFVEIKADNDLGSSSPCTPKSNIL